MKTNLFGIIYLFILYFIFFFVFLLLNFVFCFCRPIYNSWCLGKRFYIFVHLLNHSLTHCFVLLKWTTTFSSPLSLCGSQFCTNISAFGDYFHQQPNIGQNVLLFVKLLYQFFTIFFLSLTTWAMYAYTYSMFDVLDCWLPKCTRISLLWAT